ncbi:TIGR04282 family arsenosugar biosynthesis glycosyltransferase [Endozoicomonadaceae bacterium StTr2]
MAADKEACVLLFAKPPVAGKVKTRLIPALGADGACRLHQRLLEHVVEQVNASGMDACLWAADDPQHQGFENLSLSRWQRKTQPQGDLGNRMQTAAETMLKQYRKVLLIGSDCPLLNTEYFEQVLQQLEQQPVVYIPAEDGGYVLLGLSEQMLSQSMSPLFENIDWGTGSVLEQSRQHLQQAGIQWSELTELWDIDRPEDVERLSKVKPELVTGLL